MRLTFKPPIALGALTDRLRQAEILFGRPDPLLKIWGIETVKWVDNNFRVGGTPKWKPLSKWTLAGRRDPGMRKKKGLAVIHDPKPLHDTGKLARSYKYIMRGKSTIVFSDDPKAVWHEFGVKPRAEIRPKHAKALALPMLEYVAKAPEATRTRAGEQLRAYDRERGATYADAEWWGPRLRVKGQRSLKNFGSTITLPSGKRVFMPATGQRVPKKLSGRIGKTVSPYQNILFRGIIRNWPGIPARPMLPTPQQIAPVLLKKADVFILNTILKRTSNA